MHESRVCVRASTKIKIKKAVIVEIPEVRSHCSNAPIKTHFFCHIGKSTVPGVPIEFYRIALSWKTEVGSHPFSVGKEITGDQQIKFAVVVIVPKPGWKAPLWLLNTKLLCNLFERAVTFVVVEEVV